ncbi:MAG: single-stranded DNA-binding protein [Candidatus Aureabacteria bacterium]|nr:single-stranded DNA-binding protein [Candidatus Auribacterota bacterium]
MVSLNKVFVAGNLTRDPEVRYTSGGQAVADMDLAINHVYLSKTGEKKEETVFVHIVVWGKQAETAGTYLFKGSPVLVEGRLQLDSWETPEGEKRSRLKIQAQRVQFLGSPGKSKENIPPERTGAASSSGETFSPPSQEEPPPGSSVVDDDIPF